MTKGRNGLNMRIIAYIMYATMVFFCKKTKKIIKMYINVMFKLDYIEKICYNTVVKGKM